MGAMAAQITSITIVYSTVYPGADKKKTSKLRVTRLCAGNSPVTIEFPAQRASNVEIASDNLVNIGSGNTFGVVRSQAITWAPCLSCQ